MEKRKRVREGDSYRRSSDRRRRRMRKRRMIRNIIIVVVLMVLMAAAGGIFLWNRYGPTNEKADLKGYYGLTRENELAVVINNSVIPSAVEGAVAGQIINGRPYIEYSVVQDYLNERFYWDSNDSVMLYTLPEGNLSVVPGSNTYLMSGAAAGEEDYHVLETEGQIAYIALEFIQQYTGMEFSVYESPGRVVITCGEQAVKTAVLKKETEVRYQGGVKSPILAEVKKGDKVTILEDEDDWKKVSTLDGFIGYVPTKTLGKVTQETVAFEYQEPVYSNITVDYAVNMAWHNVEHQDANNYVADTLGSTSGVTTIAPTWFSIADVEGNLTSIADASYVNTAHERGVDVWAVFRDFHGGISSYDETYQVLSYTSKRQYLADQLISAALQAGVDGINLDFELISTDCGEHYVQFIRELSVRCHQNGLVFSIDNYMPQPYNEHYNLKEQGKVADYVVLMGYDEHTAGSYEAGSVASYHFVQEGVERALTVVPKERLVLGIPFFTRLWFETEKTAEDRLAEAGTEAEEYMYKVTSEALGMDEAAQALQSAGVQAEWDDTSKQNYAQWNADGGTYKIWLEDLSSLQEKLELISSYDLKGVAEWKLGQENSAVWSLIQQYVY